MPISDAELDYYHAKISLGDKARHLLGSDLGQYLLRKAQQEVDAVINAFQAVDPTDSKEIIRLQVQLKTAISVPQWLTDAIDESSMALEEYTQRKEIDRQQEKGA